MPVCKYDGTPGGCYQKGDEHLRKYAHPSRDAAVAAAKPAPSSTVGIAPAANGAAASTTSPSTSARPRSILDMLNAAAPKRTIFAPTSGSAPVASHVPATLGKAVIVHDAGGAQSPPRPTAPSTAVPVAKPDQTARRDVPAVPAPPPQPRPPQPPGSPHKSRAEQVIERPDPRPSPLGGPGASPAAVFEMPFPDQELAAVYAAARAVNPSDPLQAWAARGIVLVGPFEVLAGRAFSTDLEKWTANRALNDPPEVQSVALDTKATGTRRICFHRDDPGTLPTMVVVSPPHDASKAAHGTHVKWDIVGSSVAVAIANAVDGGSSAATAGLLKAFGPDSKDAKTTAIARRKRTIAQTASGLGIVVPYNRKTELGYRDPMIDRAKLLRMLDAVNDSRLGPKQREELDEQMRFNDISNDECDFGLGLELGLDFLAKIHADGVVTPVATHAERMLSMAYLLLGRHIFAHILQCSLSRLKTSRPTTRA